MEKELSKSKIAIAASSLVAILLLMALGIHFFSGSDNTTNNKEDSQIEEPLPFQRDLKENSKDDSGTEEKDCPQRPPARSITQKSVTSKSAGERFCEAMKKLQEDPRNESAPAHIAEAKATFSEAKISVSKGDPNYHPALQLKDLSSYFNSVIADPQISQAKKEDHKEILRLLSESPKDQPHNVPITEENLKNGKTGIVDVTDLLKLDKEALVALPQDLRIFDGVKNNDHIFRYQCFVNIHLIKATNLTVCAHANDDILREWAKSGFQLRNSPTFVQIIKNRKKYPHLQETLQQRCLTT